MDMNVYIYATVSRDAWPNPESFLATFLRSFALDCKRGTGALFRNSSSFVAFVAQILLMLRS